MFITAVETLEIDIDNIIYEMYWYFCIYTACAMELMEF
jgi:hypothetical protein